MIIFCLLGYDVLKQALIGVEKSVLKGKLVINLTNGTPNEAREMNKYMKDANVQLYIDGGIMATSSMIGAEGSAIFCSGEIEQVFEIVKPMIEIQGKSV